MKARYWSLAIVLILVNYLVFASLFSRLLNTDFGAGIATRTPVPTFTPAPAQPIAIVPTPIPQTPDPTPTATLVANVEDVANNPETEAAPQEPEPANESQLIAPGSVNIRSGPGLNYTVIGTLNANTAMTIVGRNGEGSWWQIKMPNNVDGWVANSVVSANNTSNVPVVEAPAPPPPAPVAAQPAAESSSPPEQAPPPEPEKPKYQYTPTGWYDDGNAGLTRFLGDIKDTNGNPVDGVLVQASCGDYSTISYPSGPVGWGSYGESDSWPPGFYDITIDTKPIPCIWTLTVVESDDRKTVKATLSESVPVEITNEKSIVTANWTKNW